MQMEALTKLIPRWASWFRTIFSRFKQQPTQSQKSNSPLQESNPPVQDCNIPHFISDEETIVRAVKRPSHLKPNERLKPAVFKSMPGTDDVSSMRHTHMGIEACRDKAKEISGNGKSVAYAGLAVVKASAIRSAGSRVLDTREEFCGHASIVHGFVLQRDEPADPEVLEKLNDRIKLILANTAYYPDPAPASDHWAGQAIQ